MLGTHAFIPRPFRIGKVPTCQACPCTAAHPVHDWLSTRQDAINADWHARDDRNPDSSQPQIEEVL